MDELPVSVFGEVIDPRDKVSDVYRVPPEHRLDHDDDPDANALRTDPFDPDSDDDDMVHEGPE